MPTKIEWCDEVWNPVTGCRKVSPGCANCYAERLAPRVFAGQTEREPFSDALGYGTRDRRRRFTDVRIHPERLAAPVRWRKPKRVFVNSMSDLFHEDVPDEFIAQVWDVMARCPQHTFQILTKRPERMREALTRWESGSIPMRFVEGTVRLPLPNVWLGVSVEDQRRADERIPVLIDTPGAVRFLSCEPLLGPVDLSAWLPEVGGRVECSVCGRTKQPRGRSAPLTGGLCNDDCRGYRSEPLPGDLWPRESRAEFGYPEHLAQKPTIDWLIVGGESGAQARPMDLAWARSLVEQGRAAGVPVFVKQLGRRPEGLWYLDDGDHEGNFGYVHHRAGGDPDEWPADLRVREFPEPVRT